MDKSKSLAPQPFTRILVPAPPKGHTSCLVCFDKFEDYFLHIESRQHKESARKSEFKEDYRWIDYIANSFNKEFDLNRTPKCLSPMAYPNFEDSTQDCTSIKQYRGEKEIYKFKDEMPFYGSPKESIDFHICIGFEDP